MGRRWRRENALSEQIRKPERKRPKPIPVCEDISRELARVLCVHSPQYLLLQTGLYPVEEQ